MKPGLSLLLAAGFAVGAAAAEPAGQPADRAAPPAAFTSTAGSDKGFAPAVGVPEANGGDAGFDRVLSQATLNYAERLRLAAVELAAMRERIAREKAPVLEAQRVAEDRLLAAEAAVARNQALERAATDERNRLIKEATALHKQSSYMATLAQDGLKAFGDGLRPGEDSIVGEDLRKLQAGLDEPAGPMADVPEFLLERVRQSLGGYAVRGTATVGEGNEVRNGVFAFVGPQTFFRTDDGVAGVVVRLREGSATPVMYPVPGWPAAGARALFEGAPGSIAADATGTKALRLKQTSGTVWQHIEKGGYVAFAILGVGALSVLLISLKLVDVRHLTVDEPSTVNAFLARLARDGRAGAEGALGSLRPTTRDLFATGLRHLDETKVALEERLQALLLKQRLHFERRLPLLAVIATAAPLMGLLGTVVGMVKTFALITVFGTGNAGKLASGISEVLVATELGLAVAIPTLVIHGFLSQRISRQLATLERYALEFVTVAKSNQEETISP